jgi:molybdenum cofactor cytidylyltransferase
VSTAAVLLAAGGGTRFVGATHKLLAVIDGQTVVDRAIGAALDAAIGPLYVVTGAVDVDVPSGSVAVSNPRWADGIASSLAAGIGAASADGHDAVVVGLGDQPSVAPEAWRLVAAATGTPIAVATYDGCRGNPVRLAAEVWPLLPAAGDEGARAVFGGRGHLLTEVPCPGSAADVDTLEDLRRWS